MNPSPVIHLCLATEQVLANVLPLRALPWDQLIIVASDHMRGRQKARLDLLVSWARQEAARRQLPEPAVKVEALHDTGMGWGDLLSFARHLAAQLTLEHEGSRTDFNVTGGTKLMTQAFATAFGGQARLVYCHTQGGRIEVLDAQGQTPAIELPPTLLSLTDHLQAQGFEVNGAQTATDGPWIQGVRQRQALTVALVQEGARLRMTPGVDGKRLLNVLHDMAASSLPQRARPGQAPRPFSVRATCLAPQSDVWFEVVAQLQAHGIAEVCGWANPQQGSRLELQWCSEEAARYLAGGYLEEYAALCMLALDLPPQQWALNLRLQPCHSLQPAGRDFQELDLAIVYRNRMLVLECKAGQQLHRQGSGQDILNKLDAMCSHIGGALGEGWIVSPLQLMPDWAAPILDRAEQYGIRLVHGTAAVASLPSALAQALGVAPAPLIDPALELHALKQLLDQAARSARTSAAALPQPTPSALPSAPQ